MTRGSLRIYLGASPGVGKTFAMLGEGYRRKERGTDVVIGIVETHGRQQTIAQLRDIEVVPRRTIDYRGTVLTDMDVDAILARRPDVVLVDEFAHTNAPGSRHEKRWQDVDELLDAGIDVISTLNVQHLESLNDVINTITGVVQRETVPDDLVRRADQIELVDMSPEAIRRRMAHGNIYPAERIDAALANYFRPGNLGALRELALLWVADRVEESLHDYLSAHGISAAWETRERVIVGITGVDGGEQVIRRAARIAGRLSGELVGVHVSVDDGIARADGDSLAEQRRLLGELGGEVFEVVGHDPVEALVSFAITSKATQLVLGATRRSRWHELLHGSFVARVTRLASTIDVHVIAATATTGGDERQRRARPIIDRRRMIAGWMLTVLGLPVLTAVLSAVRSHVDLSTELLLFLTLVLVIAAIGGRLIAAVSAVVGSLLVNWFLVEPLHTFTIAEPENLVALFVFFGVAVGVGTLVDTTSRRSLEARRARAEAQALARTSASLATELDPLPALLEHIRATFVLDGVRLRVPDDGDSVAGSLADGDVASGDVAGAPSTELQLAKSEPGPQPVLQLYGRALSADDQRVLRAIADQVVVALERRRLTKDAADAAALADIDVVRTALLRAVSHDLRTPLASIKAMISGLRDSSVAWTPSQMAEALATVDEESDRLNRLVGNLLDASRLQIGALAVDIDPTSVADTVSTALHSIGAAAGAVTVDIAEATPLVLSDPALFERSLANVVSNALRFAPPGDPVRIEAGVVGSTVHLRVIDRGPGILAADRAKVIAPFQRLGDQQTSDGVGLGLSIAQGFIQAMDGVLSLDDTPGGGLTVTIALPVAHAFETAGS